MSSRSPVTTMAAALCAAIVAMCGSALAASIKTTPALPLQVVLDSAQDGDIVTLGPGEYRGAIRIERSVSLIGNDGAVLVGPGSGSVVTVTAPGVTVRSLTVRGSGRDGQAMDSGIFLAQSAERATVEGNRLEGNLIGIYIHGAKGSRVAANRIEGLRGMRLNETGNGVTVWNAPNVVVEGNSVRYGRDGIYSISSTKDRFINNRFEKLRFAVHYMYTDDSEISGNYSSGNHGGFAIMYSKRLIIRGNISDHDRDFGLLLNYANYATIEGNLVAGGPLSGISEDFDGADDDKTMLPKPDAALDTATGPTKCVFIYNTNKGSLRDNWFEHCGIGVHFTAGSEGNEISGNAFIANRNQVKYVGTRNLDWSKAGRGNYWSDNPAFDLDGDGVADTAYRPNDLVDRVLWTAPAAKVLINSPAVQVLRWAQSQFPALYPGGVVDSRPLIAPPPRPSQPRIAQ